MNAFPSLQGGDTRSLLNTAGGCLERLILTAAICIHYVHQTLERGNIQCRADFEKLAGGFLERAAHPLRQILERNRVAVGDLTAVELLGGGSRVPAVKAALSQALGGRTLDM